MYRRTAVSPQPQQNDADFWRGWNSQAANQWNAYDQGQQTQTPDFGAYSNQYAQNQQVAHLPFAEQQSYLMNQHRMGQDAIQNRLALMGEQRQQNAQGFNQGLNLERLQLQRNAAMQRFQPDPMDQLKHVASAFDVEDPYPLLQNYDQSSGMVNLPQFDKATGQPSAPRQIPFSPQMFDSTANLWNAANPNLPKVELLGQKAARLQAERTAKQAELERLKAERTIRGQGSMYEGTMEDPHAWAPMY